MADQPDYDELFERAFEVPDGAERIGVFEELIRLADSNKEVAVAFHARRQLVSSANSGGFPEKAIVAFAWCLNQFDKDEELDDWFDLMWEYKVILEWVPVFARVTRQQITEMQEDMANRFAEEGESERTAHYYRSWNFMRMGDYETALEYQTKYTKMKRSDSSDCKACELDRQIELLSRMRKDEEALTLAKPVISGRSSCGEVPEFTNGHIVRSMLRLGQVDEAFKRQQKGYDIVKSERKYLGTIGDLMHALTRTGAFDIGIQRMSNHLPWASESAADELKFRFYSACSLLLESFAKDNPKPRKFRIPTLFSFHREDDTYDPKELAECFANETKLICDLFDKRNGNDTFTRFMEDNRSLCGLDS